MFPDCTRDGTGFQKTAGHWQSALVVLLTPFWCKNRAEWGQGIVYFISAFQSYHELHCTRVVTPRTGSGRGTEKTLPWSEKELFGHMILAYLLPSILEKQLEEMEKKKKRIKPETVKRDSPDGWNTIGVADHSVSGLCLRMIFGEGRRYCYWCFR